MKPLEFLNAVPLAAIMLIVALGYLLGRLSIRGVTLGAPGFTLALALIFGEWGVEYRSLYGRMSPPITLGSFGVALFIYSIGYEAGPRFFASLRGRNGWKYVSVGAVITVAGTALALAIAPLLGMSTGATVGALSGALTAAPTFAAAATMIRETGVVGRTAEMTVAFAICYPIGFIGQGLIIQLGPKVLRENLSRGTAVDVDATDASGRTVIRKRDQGGMFTRAYFITKSEVLGRPLRELRLNEKTGVVISFLIKGDEVIVPDGNTMLEANHYVMATGSVAELNKFESLIGEEVFRRELWDRLPPARRVVVTAKEAVGKRLADLHLVRQHKCLITKIERADETIDPTADVSLQRDDIVEVVGATDDVRAVTPRLGRFERASYETDIGVFAAGMFLGLVLGGVKWGFIGLNFALGNSIGLLISGIVVGRFRQIGPFSAHVPRAARSLMRDLGLLLYLAETGVRAGPSLTRAMEGMIWPSMIAALVVMCGACFSGVATAKWILRLRPVETWGSLSGGLTSTTLPIVKRMADSNEPAISFAASFAGASLLLPFAGQLVVAILK